MRTTSSSGLCTHTLFFSLSHTQSEQSRLRETAWKLPFSLMGARKHSALCQIHIDKMCDHVFFSSVSTWYHSRYIYLRIRGDSHLMSVDHRLSARFSLDADSEWERAEIKKLCMQSERGAHSAGLMSHSIAHRSFTSHFGHFLQFTSTYRSVFMEISHQINILHNNPIVFFLHDEQVSRWFPI